MPIASSTRFLAFAGVASALLSLPGTVGAQERPLPWGNEQRSVQPYDERRDQDPQRFESRPLDPPSSSNGSTHGPGAYGSSSSGYGSGQGYGGSTFGNASGARAPVPYGSSGPSQQRDDTYRPSYPTAREAPEPRSYSDRDYSDRPYSSRYEQPGYGRSYEPPPPYRDDPPPAPRHDDGPRDGSFSMREIRDAGHGFFGSISQGLASVFEYAFKNKGRPNGYILGEDLGGAFVGGLRYGEGTLFTKDAGNHKVYWQGPSLGFDAGAEGSKVMVLVYNMRDPSDIYQRFGGVAGSAYVVGGVGLTFQSNNDIVVAPIRSGIGLRLGANIGYLKYTRRPTWNPF